jgi:hypothetical protein
MRLTLLLFLFFIGSISFAKTEKTQTATLSPMQHCLYKCAGRGMSAYDCAKRCNFPVEKHYGELFNTCINSGRNTAACVKSAHTEASTSMEKTADSSSAQRKVKAEPEGGAQ